MIELEVGPAQRFGSLTVFPLLARSGAGSGEGLPPVLLLSEALDAGTLHVTEVGQGTVPWLLVLNHGPEPVLILDGDQLLGGRQNRVVSRSILLGADSDTKIPVSCMERGRWSSVAREMRTAPQQAPVRVRRKARSVEATYAAQGSAAAEEALGEAQSDVWSEIAKMSARFHDRSPTEALDHLYEARRVELEEGLRVLRPVEGQRGLLAFQGRRPLGLDALGSPELWFRLHDRFLRGYLLDVGGGGREAEARDSGRGQTHEPDGGPALERSHAQAFLQRVQSAARTDAPTVGIGRYAVLSAPVLGGELAHEEALVHVSAFPRGEDFPSGGGSGLGGWTWTRA